MKLQKASILGHAFAAALLFGMASCAPAPQGNMAAAPAAKPAPAAKAAPATAAQAPASQTAAQATTNDGLSTSTPRVILRWQTETESGTFGYYVYRADSANGKMVCINQENPVHGGGTSTVPLKYAYFDLDVKMGDVFYYKLQSRDLDGSTEWIVGDPEPVKGTAKPLKDTELVEIRTKGKAYKEEAQ